MRSRLLATLVLAAFSIATSLVLAEAALRWLRPQPLAFSWLTPHGLRLHAPSRELVSERQEFRVGARFNALGFRGEEFAVPKPPGRFRILALGDSFTEGLQVEEHETFVARIAAGLGDAPVDALNLGVSGYGTSGELAVLRLFGPILQPDLVLVFFCLQNDVYNNIASDLCRLGPDGVHCRLPERPSAGELRFDHLKSWFATRFHLWQLMRAATSSDWFYRMGLRAAPPTEPSRKEARDTYREPPPPALADGLALTQGVLGELRDFAASLGAETWVVLIPAREQIWDHEWEAILAVDDAPETLVRNGAQRQVGDRARALGIPVIDLYDAFRARRAAGDDLYWMTDAHFDAQGHAVTADAVLAALRARGLPPEAAR
jgi:lysophospholipase L1-like esterase